MIKHFCCLGATTVEVWTTMPKSVSCHLSPRSAISARASITWSPAAQSKHNSPHQALRENRLPWKETREVTATRHRLPRRQIKLKVGPRWSTEANQIASTARKDTRFLPSCWSCFWIYLRLKKKYSWRMFFSNWCNTQEDFCTIALAKLARWTNHCC